MIFLFFLQLRLWDFKWQSHNRHFSIYCLPTHYLIASYASDIISEWMEEINMLSYLFTFNAYTKNIDWSFWTPDRCLYISTCLFTSLLRSSSVIMSNHNHIGEIRGVLLLLKSVPRGTFHIATRCRNLYSSYFFWFYPHRQTSHSVYLFHESIFFSSSFQFVLYFNLRNSGMYIKARYSEKQNMK